MEKNSQTYFNLPHNELQFCWNCNEPMEYRWISFDNKKDLFDGIHSWYCLNPECQQSNCYDKLECYKEFEALN